MNQTYDVVVCGGGLAGLTLARQLKLSHNQLRILVLEKREFPMPEDHCKVGESTVEISSFYFAETLQLKDYFKNSQLKKLGFRFILGNGKTDAFHERPEIGLSGFPAYDSFQIDRGIFENDLVEINRHNDITIEEGVTVQDIEISENDSAHKVTFKRQASGEQCQVFGNWVIDASGRRRLIQKKLNLTVPPKQEHSSVWFRIRGRIDIESLVPASVKPWHARVPNKIRYYSTNHVIGKGYWVWFIPLPSYATSIGIVTAESVHPFNTYATQEKAWKWISENEPAIAQLLDNKQLIDFAAIRNYSYSSRQVFSSKRWACVGEAAVFTDPFYSPGSNLITYKNSIVTSLIGDDLKHQLTDERVTELNDFVIQTNDYLTEAIQSSYLYFDKPLVKALSFLWDIVVGWSFATPSVFNGIFLSAEKKDAIKKESRKYFGLIHTMERFFQQWGNRSKANVSFDYINYLGIAFVKEIYVRNLKSGKSVDEISEDYKQNLETLEIFAQVIFLIALEDVCPETLSAFKRPFWVNVQAISLDKENWELNGLFDAESKPRDITGILRQVRELFQKPNPAMPDNQNREEFVSINLSI